MFSTSLMSTGSHPDFIQTLARRTRSPEATETTLARRRTGRRRGEDIPNPEVDLQPLVQARTHHRTAQVRTTQVRTGPDPSLPHARVDKEVFATPVVALAIPRTSAPPMGRPVNGAASQDTSLRYARHRRQFSMRPSPSPSQNLPPQFKPTLRRCSVPQCWSRRKLLPLSLHVFSPRPRLLIP